MLRRLSILVRQRGRSREAFARAWEYHGTLVKTLPGIRTYRQNHVVQEFAHVGPPPPFRIDGIVELRFDSLEAMQAAFASDAAEPVKADEPNFLGHGTGYATTTAAGVQPAAQGEKLILVGRHARHPRGGEAMASLVAALPDLTHWIRDDVALVIPRPEMADGPQIADTFLHAYFAGADAAQRGAETLARTADGVCSSLVRVRTHTVV